MSHETRPFHIALLGDFSGRASRGALESGRALATRRTYQVDRDNLDDVLRAIGPELTIDLAGNEPIVVRFAEIDDFSPEALANRLPHFRRLHDARDLAATPTATPARRNPPGSLLDDILADTPAPSGVPTARSELRASPPADPFAEFIDRAVSPHVAPDHTPADPGRVAEVGDRIVHDMRTLLHDRTFQALEAAWRGVEFLVRRLETGESLKVFLVDVAKPELMADLTGVTDPTQSGTYRLLVDSTVGTHGGVPWAAIVGLFSFADDPADVALLQRLGTVASAAGAPFLAAADAGVVGCPSFGEAPDPDDWTDYDAPEWDALRRSAAAAHIGLALPRFLLRLPYGRDGLSSDLEIDFEELTPSSGHEDYLWGNSSLLCALLLAESFQERGWEVRPELDVGGLPLALVRRGGDVTAVPCAEAVLTDRAVGRIGDKGVMAVRSRKGGDAVRLFRFQSLADPLAALAGRWSSAEAHVGR